MNTPVHDAHPATEPEAPVRVVTPIFFAKTRSFLLGVVPTVLTTIDLAFQYSQGEHAAPVANAVAAVLQALGADLTGEQIAGTMQTLYPLYLLIFAQQRGTFSGKVPRPWAAKPSKEQSGEALLVEALGAYKTGDKLGRAFKEALRK